MKNLGRKFATMDEDERRRFTLKSEGGTDSRPDEVDLENPRKADTLGPIDPEDAEAAADDERR